MDQRPVRMPDSEHRIRRSLSLPPTIARAVDEIAAQEGHRNFSAIVLRALIDFLNRHNDARAA
jgi:metal-responsive CopG/Arc/MetJ family transcriptional regulator